MKQVIFFLVMILAFSLNAENVTLMVNMNYQMELGNFNPAIDFVDVAGNFNAWGGSGAMMDENENGIYSVTVPGLTVGFICEYKFRINANWATSEFPGGGANRFYTVVAGENIVEHWYNNQMPPMGDPALITFIINDSAGMLYSGFYLKGSWDANGVYDAAWGNGLEHAQFVDDGTNGDETANDNIWTVQVELYPDNGAHTWQWGINDDAHIWIAGNFEFQVIDDSPQTLSYTILSLTDMDVMVTFQVDMNLLENVSDVFIAGDFNGWSGINNPMNDVDTDGIFIAEILFPMGSNRYQEYKFINGEEWEFVNNRFFQLDDTAPLQILDVVNFNNMSPYDFISQDVTVAFRVNMTNVEQIGVVTIAGDFNGWNTTDYILDDFNFPGIHRIDILFAAGSYRYHEYKYLNDGVYEDGFNRWLEIDDSNATQLLDVVFFSDDVVSSDESLLPNVIAAFNNYPNPFNPSTTISFSINEALPYATIKIINVKGQLVEEFHFENLNSGIHQIEWNGKDKSGKSVASGLYFSILQTHRETLSQKMILLK